MSPLEVMQRLAALVPRPRLHLMRLHGVLAPNSKLRWLVVPQGPPKDEQAPGIAASGVQCEAETAQVGPGRTGWARLLKRVFDIDMQRCPHCGAGELKIIAAIQERPVIEKILAHLGLGSAAAVQGSSARGGAALRCLSRLRCRIPIATGCGYPAAGVVLRAVSAGIGQHQGRP